MFIMLPRVCWELISPSLRVALYGRHQYGLNQFPPKRDDWSFGSAHKARYVDSGDQLLTDSSIVFIWF